MAQMAFLERLFVNSPLAAWLQKREVAHLASLAPPARWLSILDLGCGRGVEPRLVTQAFRPGSLVAFDLDARQVRQAATYLRRTGAEVVLLLADASRLPFRDGQFDAVVEMEVMHHVREWRGALREIVRVLKPGGRFYFADISKIRYGVVGMRLLGHDIEALFSRDEFRQGLADAGLSLADGLARPATPVVDIVGVARKAA